MTTAARPTFEPARGGRGKGEGDLSALSKQYSSRDLPGHTKIKYRWVHFRCYIIVIDSNSGPPFSHNFTHLTNKESLEMFPSIQHMLIPLRQTYLLRHLVSLTIIIQDHGRVCLQPFLNTLGCIVLKTTAEISNTTIFKRLPNLPRYDLASASASRPHPCTWHPFQGELVYQGRCWPSVIYMVEPVSLELTSKWGHWRLETIRPDLYAALTCTSFRYTVMLEVWGYF